MRKIALICIYIDIVFFITSILIFSGLSIKIIDTLKRNEIYNDLFQKKYKYTIIKDNNVSLIEVDTIYNQTNEKNIRIDFIKKNIIINKRRVYNLKLPTQNYNWKPNFIKKKIF